jgi:ATPase subunit of ABC transporter with duplicated ATPase domains
MKTLINKNGLIFDKSNNNFDLVLNTSFYNSLIDFKGTVLFS